MSLKITISPSDRTLVITAAAPADGEPQQLVVPANAIFPLAEALQNGAAYLDVPDPPAYVVSKRVDGYGVSHNNKLVATCPTQEAALLVARALNEQHGRGRRFKEGPRVAVVTGE